MKWNPRLIIAEWDYMDEKPGKEDAGCSHCKRPESSSHPAGLLTTKAHRKNLRHWLSIAVADWSFKHEATGARRIFSPHNQQYNNNRLENQCLSP